MKLLIDWQDFSNQMKILIKQAERLDERNMEVNNTSELDKFAIEEKLWREECITFLKEAFDNDINQFANDFNYTSRKRFQTGKQSKDFRTIRRDFFDDFREKRKSLQYFFKIIGVCDAIIKPNKIDLDIRAGYSTEEIMDLILDKLFDLYGDTYFDIAYILEGNGIKLKKRHEDRELISYLESIGYVNSNQTMNEAYAQLSMQGKLYIEEKRKAKSLDYSKIHNSSTEVNYKIDEIIQHLETLGLGQEILFEELEELKNLYTQINKKNWGQVLKGKLVDLGLAQVINQDTMKYVFKELTDEILQLS